jgi:hypothetical protein
MRLHEQVKVLKAENEVLEDGLKSLRSYLNSAKFGVDIMVNKNDVLLRIEEIQHSVQSVEYDFWLNFLQTK